MSQRDLAETLIYRGPGHAYPSRARKGGGRQAGGRPDDQRITRVFLTAEGRRQELENHAAFEEYINQTIGRLSDQDKLELTRLLDEVSGYTAELVCPGVPDHRRGRRREAAPAHLSPALPQPHQLIVMLVLVQSIGNLYLPTLNADIINFGIAKATRTTSFGPAASCSAWRC